MRPTRKEIRKALEDLRHETAAALEEFDHVKAAGLRKAARHLERMLDEGHRSTAEDINRKNQKIFGIKSE